MKQIRDISVIKLPTDQLLLTACDISASIGSKENDVLQVDPDLTGRLTARTALIEIIATGAEVVAVTNVIGTEMDPTGKRVISGIVEELKSAGLEHIILNGSTEDNMETSQTSVGVVVNGIGQKAHLKMNNIHETAFIYGFGKPKVGVEILRQLQMEVGYQLVRQLVDSEAVMEVVPVGSKGIRSEAELLVHENNCSFHWSPNCPKEWLEKSAGPSTAVIVAVRKEYESHFISEFPQAYLLGFADKRK